MTLAASHQLDFTDNHGRSIAPDSAPHPLAILESAVRGGADVNTLERISVLAREWKADAARQQYAEAMARLQSKLPVVVMDSENKHTHSRYAKLETIQRAIKNAYLAEGFTVTFSEDGAPVNENMHIVGVVRHIGGHQEVFHRYAPADTTGPEGKANKTKVQGSQSTMSYVSRRLLCEIFGVTIAGEDRDGSGDAFITSEQLSILSQSLKEAKRDMDRFLKWAAADSLALVTVGKFNEFMGSIRLMKNTAQTKEG